MPWPAPVVALLCAALGAALTAALAGPVLRRLPEPDDPDGKPPYRSLATPAFAATVGACSLVASLAVTAWTPAHHWPAWAALTTCAMLAACVDARTTWLPLPLAWAGWSVAAVGTGVAAVAASDPLLIARAGLGALALGGFFHVVWRLSAAVGYGDVRLMATVGAVTALDSAGLVGWSALLGALAGAVWGVAHRVRRGHGPFPYGPGLLAGPFLALGLQALTG